MDEQDEYRPLTREDLDRIAGETLPDRVAISLLKARVSIPTNLAVAAREISEDDGSSADGERRIDRAV